MKKLLVMMAMAVGFTVFADSQNDKLISFSTSGTSYYQDGLTKVVDNECFALVWIKDGESFGGFNVDGTLKDQSNNKLVRVVNFAKDGHCPPITFVISANEVETIYAGGSFAVYLLDTRDANGQPTVAQNNTVGRVNWFGKCDDSSAEVDVAEDVAKVFGSYVCRYADGKQVFEGERCLLVSCPAEGAFRGLDWDGTLLDKTDNAIVDTFLADANGKFSINLEGKIETGKNYELIVLDSRIPDGSALASKLGETLVSAFGEFMLNSDGSAIEGVKWNAVKMGLSATYPELCHSFSYDPTLNLEKGYAVISPEDGKWQVYKLPEAWVAPYESPELSLKSGTYWHLGKNKSDIPDPFKLESAYKFSAFDIKYEEKALAYLRGDYSKLEASDYQLLDDWNKQVTPFKEWNADFEVSFDRPVAANSVLLAGFYNYTSAWAGKYTFDWVGEGQKDPWVGSSPEKDLAAGEVTRLLYSYIGKSGNVTMTYDEICQKVIQFFCGVKNLSEKNYGTTMTVKLCIYENTGRCHESGSKIVIGTYRYTFCGPLTVKFNKGPEHEKVAELKDIDLPENFTTNFDGKAAILLPVPKYEGKIENWAFVGWSNSVDLVNLVYVPTNTWGDLELWSVWKKAQTTQVAPTGGTAKVDIKVTQEWIDENLPQGAAVAEELEKKNDKGLEIWKTYVLGMNPSGTVEVVATEKKSDDTALVVSTVQAPPPDSGFKVTYSLDKIEQDESVRHAGAEQDTKDIEIPLAVEEGKELPTGYYKMNVFITPVENGKEEEKVQVKSETTVGVLTVQTEEKLVPVSVPWKSLENIEKDIPINEIVQPQGLTEGDTLSVYDQEKKVYNTFVLENSLWKPSVVYTIDSTGAKKVVDGTAPATVSRGSGMWLNRKETGKPFHLFGQYDKEPASTKIQKPVEEGKSEYNLIAPTGIEDTDLNTIPSLNPGAAGAEDKLMIVNNGVPVYYNYKNGKWGYNRQKVVKIGNIVGVKSERVDEAKVGAGLGLWYISKGGEPEINWQNGEQPAEPVQE